MKILWDAERESGDEGMRTGCVSGECEKGKVMRWDDIKILITWHWSCRCHRRRRCWRCRHYHRCALLPLTLHGQRCVSAWMRVSPVYAVRFVRPHNWWKKAIFPFSRSERSKLFSFCIIFASPILQYLCKRKWFILSAAFVLRLVFRPENGNGKMQTKWERERVGDCEVCVCALFSLFFSYFVTFGSVILIEITRCASNDRRKKCNALENEIDAQRCHCGFASSSKRALLVADDLERKVGQ